MLNITYMDVSGSCRTFYEQNKLEFACSAEHMPPVLKIAPTTDKDSIWRSRGLIRKRFAEVALNRLF